MTIGSIFGSVLERGLRSMANSYPQRSIYRRQLVGQNAVGMVLAFRPLVGRSTPLAAVFSLKSFVFKFMEGTWPVQLKL